MKKKLRFFYATLALTASTLVFSACDPLSFLQSETSTSQKHSSETQDILELPPVNATGLINSLDKLNYYAARKTIAEHLANKAVKSDGYAEELSSEAALDSDYGEDTIDSDYGEDVSETPEYGDSTEPTDSAETQRPQDTDTKVYYDLYDWGTFTVKRTVYFQINLSDENGFLASRLGTGIVEVAISMGDIYDDLNMITFRNGERFFSCMYHGYEGINEATNAQKYAFAAYRFIEGFYYVKDLQYEHYEFHIEVSELGDDAVFRCDYRYSGEADEQVTVVENSTYCIDKEVTYTIEELEEYFNPSVKADSASERNA